MNIYTDLCPALSSMCTGTTGPLAVAPMHFIIIIIIIRQSGNIAHKHTNKRHTDRQTV